MPDSAYIAYFDESGDHGLAKIDPTFPVFVLCCALFKKDRYIKPDVCSFSELKFKYFSHDATVFHSHKIRKRIGEFKILADPDVRADFYSDVAQFFNESSCTLIAAGINKMELKKQYVMPFSPYNISLLFCLERLYGQLLSFGAHNKKTVCVFEARGPKEDSDLELIFRRICDGSNQWKTVFPFEPVFAKKDMNLTGLQITDLAAYPIARYIMAPDEENLAYEAVKTRLRRSPAGKVHGWGLKIFP